MLDIRNKLFTEIIAQAAQGGGGVTVHGGV